MTDPKVHPTLEAVARAIHEAGNETYTANWECWLPEARAALNALADSAHWPAAAQHRVILHEIAAEPKPPTVVDVLTDYLYTQPQWSKATREEVAAQMADMLAAAGLLREGVES